MFYLKRLWYRKWMTLIFTVIFLLLFLAIPYGIYSSWESKEVVMDILDSTERGNYDILIKDILSEALPQVEPNLNVVIDNWDADSSIRLSDEQWQTLTSDPRLELVAPLSILGYVPSAPQTLVLPQPENPGNYRYKIDYYTTDGQNEYLLDSQYQYALNNEIEVVSQFPETYHFLVAVDPVAEEKLTGIDYSFLAEKPANISETEIPVPIMQRKQLPTPLTVKVTIEELGEVDDSSNLETMPGKNPQIIEANLQEALKPFTGGTTRLRADGQLNTETNAPISFPAVELLTPEIVNYYANTYGDFNSRFPYEGPLKVPKLLPQTLAKEIRPADKTPFYRNFGYLNLSDAWLEKGEPTLVITDINTFEPPTLNETAPLGIYNHIEAVDENGNLIFPTALGGSFITQIASGITTIDVPKRLKGGENYLTSIRLKVADTAEYNQESRNKIIDLGRILRNDRQIVGATEAGVPIYAADSDPLSMSLGVQIVTGSAIHPQLLDVEDMGPITATWLKLGVVPTLVNDFNRITFTTLILFTVFSLCWLQTRLQAESSLIKEEAEILSHIGWTEAQIRKHSLRGQQIFLVILDLIALTVFFITKAPPIMYLISVLFLSIALIVPFVKVPQQIRNLYDPNRFKFKEAIKHYWHYYLPIIALLWVAYGELAIITSSQYRVLLNFNRTDLGQNALSPVTEIMVLLLVLTCVMTVIAIFESITVILGERKDEFTLYQKVGWTDRQIYFYLLRESFGWVAKPLLSVTLVSAILSMLLSYIFGVTIVILVASLFLVALINVISRKITITSWLLLGAIWLVSLLLGLVYSQDLVLPTILITFAGLAAVALLIVITLYFSLKRFLGGLQ